jgi:hypothetical protein
MRLQNVRNVATNLLGWVSSVSEPLYQSWTKGIQGVGGTPQRSLAWAAARRGHFRCYSDRVECGDWVIPAGEVRDAVLYETRQAFIPVSVLEVSTPSQTFQFGFNPWSRVAAFLPFAFRRERVRLRHSRFSMAAYVVGFSLLALWLWRFLRNG